MVFLSKHAVFPPEEGKIVGYLAAAKRDFPECAALQLAADGRLVQKRNPLPRLGQRLDNVQVSKLRHVPEIPDGEVSLLYL